MRLRKPHKVVYWAPAGADGFGRPAVAPNAQAVEFDARWVGENSETINDQGDNVIASHTVYLEGSVAPRGLMMQGTLQDLQESGFPTDPRQDPRVREIISVGSTPNLKSSQTIYVAKLR